MADQNWLKSYIHFSKYFFLIPNWSLYLHRKYQNLQFLENKSSPGTHVCPFKRAPIFWEKSPYYDISGGKKDTHGGTIRRQKVSHSPKITKETNWNTILSSVAFINLEYNGFRGSFLILLTFLVFFFFASFYKTHKGSNIGWTPPLSPRGGRCARRPRTVAQWLTRVGANITWQIVPPCPWK